MTKKEAKLTHQAGVKFGCQMNSGQMPLLDYFLKAGIDVLQAVEPVLGREVKISLKPLKEKLRGRVCIWGGVDGLTVEGGTKKSGKSR